MKALKPFLSSNNHHVALYGRLFFTVTSASRKGLLHFVDLEPTEYLRENGEPYILRSVCTCEAFKYGERPCRHIAACFEAIAEWANIPEDHREEWSDRLMFLMNMGQSFIEALQSDSLRSLRNMEERPEPTPKKRTYQLDPNKKFKPSSSIQSKEQQ